jgi:hypothetical protein
MPLTSGSIQQLRANDKLIIFPVNMIDRKGGIEIILAQKELALEQFLCIR